MHLPPVVTEGWFCSTLTCHWAQARLDCMVWLLWERICVCCLCVWTLQHSCTLGCACVCMLLQQPVHMHKCRCVRRVRMVRPCMCICLCDDNKALRQTKYSSRTSESHQLMTWCLPCLCSLEGAQLPFFHELTQPSVIGSPNAKDSSPI